MLLKKGIYAFFCLIGFSLNALANEETGFYGGLQIGETNSHYDTKQMGLQASDSRDLGFSGRGYIGYQWQEDFGFEWAYTRFKQTRVLDINGSDNNGKIQEQAFDGTLQAHLNLKPSLFLTGRFGLAYLCSKPNKNLRNMSTNDYTHEKIEHVRPLFGAGLAYQLSEKWVIEANWMHLLRHRAIPEGSLISIGFAYYSGIQTAFGKTIEKIKTEPQTHPDDKTNKSNER